MTAVSFKNRVVIVTGAGSGLGRSYALDIAKRGGAVLVNDLGCTSDGVGASRDLADSVVAEIKAAGGRAVASDDDVGTREGARRMVAAALDNFGRVDALINNAGILRCAWIEDLKDEDRDAVITTHLLGTFYATQAVWPHMKARGYGRIVFVTSAAGMLGNKTQASYGAAKGGITGLMNVLSQEGEPFGILCNALMPNADTRLAEKMIPEGVTDIMPYATMVYSAMAPTFTAGTTVYLASESCTSTHSIYSALGGRIARVLIGVTAGWQGSREQPATADDIAAHIEEIRDPKRGIHIPTSLADEFRIVATGVPPVA